MSDGRDCKEEWPPLARSRLRLPLTTGNGVCSSSGPRRTDEAKDKRSWVLLGGPNSPKVEHCAAMQRICLKRICRLACTAARAKTNPSMRWCRALSCDRREGPERGRAFRSRGGQEGWWTPALSETCLPTGEAGKSHVAPEMPLEDMLRILCDRRGVLRKICTCTSDGTYALDTSCHRQGSNAR